MQEEDRVAYNKQGRSTKKTSPPAREGPKGTEDATESAKKTHERQAGINTLMQTKCLIEKRPSAAERAQYGYPGMRRATHLTDSGGLPSGNPYRVDKL